MIRNQVSGSSGQTRLVGVIGWPVSHSRSPAMHNAAFAALGLDWAYVPLPVPPERVGDAVRGLVALGFAGANVTVPHKQAVIPFLDELTPVAQAVGAVNTILVRPDGTLLGDNTDGAGFMADLQAHGVEFGRGRARTSADANIAENHPRSSAFIRVQSAAVIGADRVEIGRGRAQTSADNAMKENHPRSSASIRVQSAAVIGADRVEIGRGRAQTSADNAMKENHPRSSASIRVQSAAVIGADGVEIGRGQAQTSADNAMKENHPRSSAFIRVQSAAVIGADGVEIARGRAQTSADNAMKENHPRSSAFIRVQSVVIVGAGGAARAVAYALTETGATVAVVNRTPDHTVKLCQTIAASLPQTAGRVAAHPFPEALAELAAGADLIVNATSLGLHEGDPLPWDAAIPFRPGQIVYDLIYNRPTELLARARAQGAIALDGLGMLVHQGARAFELWTGMAAPVEVMLEAIRAA